MASSKKKMTVQMDSDSRGAERGLSAVRKSTADTNKAVEKLDASSGGLASQFEGLSRTAKMGLAVSIGRNLLDALVAVAGKMKEVADTAFQTSGTYQGMSLAIEPARKATRGLVKDTELILKSNEALTTGIVSTSAQYADLADITTRLAHVNGVDYAEALSIVNNAMASGRKTGLQALGLVIDKQGAEERYAASLGRTRASLSEMEKLEAFRAEAWREMEKGAEGVTLEMDSLAGKAKAASVEMDNFWDSFWGGGPDEMKLMSIALEEHGWELVNLARASEHQGAAQEELNEILAEYGIKLDEEAEKQAWAAKVREQAANLRQQEANAQVEAIEAQERQNALEEEGVFVVRDLIAETQREIENMQAAGASADQVALAQLRLTDARITEMEAQKEAVGLTAEETEKLAKLRREMELQAIKLEAAQKRGRGGGGRRKRKTQAEIFKEITDQAIAEMAASAAARAELEAFFQEEEEKLLDQWERDEQDRLERERAALEARLLAKEEAIRREIELEQAKGAATEALEARLLAVRVQNAETLGQVDQAQEMRHRAEVERIAEMTREREAAQAKQAAMASDYTATIGQMVVASSQATGSFRENMRAEVNEFAKTQATKLGLQSAGHFASAIAYAAALNPVKAAAEATAGGIAAAKAGGFAALAGATSGGMDGVSRGGGGLGAPSPYAPGAGASSSSSSAAPSPGGSSSNDAPVSPFDPGAQGNVPAGQAAGSVVVNIGGSVLSDGDLARKIRDVVRDGRAA